ncbi:Hypothetical Protein FCC1311_117962, partial [Hondaea fermentalgiana]
MESGAAREVRSCDNVPSSAAQFKQHVTWMIANRLHSHYAHLDLVSYFNYIVNDEDNGMTPRVKANLVYPIYQIYAYMLRTFCKYGVLSTANITWFLKLDANNDLHITRGYECTGHGTRDNPKFAYFRLLLKVSKGCRLEVSDDFLSSLGQVDGLNSMGRAWKKVYEQVYAARANAQQDPPLPPAAGTGAVGGNQVSSGQIDSVVTDGSGDTAAPTPPSPQAILRDTLLPLSQADFPYYGGVRDRLSQSEDNFGFILVVNTGGLDQMIAVKTPELDPYEDSNDESEAEEMRLHRAFTNEIEVYEALRPLWGSKHVPWFLYGGVHLFSDFIVATTFEGR